MPTDVGGGPIEKGIVVYANLPGSKVSASVGDWYGSYDQVGLALESQLPDVEIEVTDEGGKPEGFLKVWPESYKEARGRVLKVPSPEFLINRLKGRKEALILSGASHDKLVGEVFTLVNERKAEDEPTKAFGRITFTQEPRSISNIRSLGRRRESVDPLMLREFEVREAPFFILKLQLKSAFATPKKLSGVPPGRFSSTVELPESENENLDEAFHIRDLHWKPVPEDGSCPASHSNKLKSPEGEDRCYTDSAAAALRQSKEVSEQERPSLKAQTYILSKERFETQAEANKWMDENDVPRPKVDETEGSFRYRQFPPDRCQEGSERTTSITDGVQIVGCRLKPEFQEQDEEQGQTLPKTKTGLTIADVLEKMKEKGEKFSQEETNFQERAPSPEVACGTCRFYLRNPDGSAIGLCQVVEGAIPWSATSDLYVSAAAEAQVAFALEKKEEPVQEAEMLDGIVMKPPYGRLIWEGKKTVILKDKELQLPNPAYIVSASTVYGIATFKEHPRPIEREEFKRTFNEHKINESQRKKQFPRRKTLWAYSITDFEPFDPIRKFEPSPGVKAVEKNIRLKEPTDQVI